MMNQETKHTPLLPCPFCGNDPEWIKEALSDGHYYIRCPECQFILKADRRDKVIGIWNNRMNSYAELKADNEKLQAFKDYVHKRLDDAGIPVDPESPHKAAGCRIGGRLDIALQLASENERLKLLLEKCFYKIEDIEDQGPPGYGWQSQDLIDFIASIKSALQKHGQ